MAVENLAPRPLADASAVIDDLIAATGDGMEAVNSLILSRSDSSVDMVPEVANHLIDAGGKRLRPMLTLAASALFSRVRGNEIRFAAAVEFMHNATLLHDDVVDESDMRRGRPAARTTAATRCTKYPKRPSSVDRPCPDDITRARCTGRGSGQVCGLWLSAFSRNSSRQ